MARTIAELLGETLKNAGNVFNNGALAFEVTHCYYRVGCNLRRSVSR
jgi:hypothetical protein